MILTGTQESSRGANRPASSNSDQKEATTIDEIQEDSSFDHQKEAEPIEIGRDKIYSVAFLPDGKHVVSGGHEGKIRRWRVEDGQEVGWPMNAGSPVFNIAVSQDEKWVVSGTRTGLVRVWNAESHSKVTELKAHNGGVYAVDVSPHGTRIATGSRDDTLCVWLSTGERLLGPVKHDNLVVSVKFSPNGRLIATATWDGDVRVYDSHNGGLLVQFPVQVNSTSNQSLAWASDSKQLLALSRDGNINCLEVSSGKTPSKWRIHSSDNAMRQCIALASNGTFIAASASSSVSFWDTATHEQIGSVIKRTHPIVCMAISSNYDLVTAGSNKITVRNLCDVLPSYYSDNVSAYITKTHVRSLSNHNPAHQS